MCRNWVGGLLPLLFCMRLAKGRWQNAAIYTMMRFSRVGHYAVAGVLLTGVVNALLILGIHIPGRLATCSFVVQMCSRGVDGGNCAGKSVFSGATVPSGFRARTTDVYQDDTGRGGAGRAGSGNGQSVCYGNPSDKVNY